MSTKTHWKITLLVKRFFTFYFDKWLVPVLFFAMSIGLAKLNDFWKNEILFFISYNVLWLGFFGLAVSTVSHISRGRLLYGIVSGLILISFFVYITVDTLAEFLKG